MFRNMRRGAQMLPESDCLSVLEKGTSGVLAVSGDDGYPYAVPLSYVYRDGRFIFHCAVQGHKLDAIRANPKASFCVVDQDVVVPEKLTTYYRSVIAFGVVRVVDDPAEKRSALQVLCEKFAPGERELCQAEIAGELNRVAIVELLVEHMTGKEAKELVNRRPG